MNYVSKQNQQSYFTDNELKDLRKQKVQSKISDTDYMSAHPEINLIIQDLYVKLFNKKPSSDEIYPFIATYFQNLYEDYCNAHD